MSPAIVTLLTDFGTADTYVAQMKGVMLGIDPTLRLVDLTHDIPPQDILEGAFQLATAVEAFPPGTVHLAVVDPGVGTERRAVAVRTRQAVFVAPDNGVLSFVLTSGVEEARELVNPRLHREAVTATFHGRDIFAPSAAAFASGRAALADAGPALDPAALVRLGVPEVRVTQGAVSGPVVSIDRFGNCLTLIRPQHIPAGRRIAAIECGEFRAERLSRTYGEQLPGEPVALIGSFGTLELAACEGDAARRWSIERGDIVTVRMAAEN